MATNAAQETHCKSLLFTEMTYARETANDVKATNPIFNIKILANEWQKIWNFFQTSFREHLWNEYLQIWHSYAMQNNTSQIYQTSSKKSSNLRLDDCDLADSLPAFPRKVFTKFFTEIFPSQKLRFHQVDGKTFSQIIKWLKDTKLQQK